LLRRGGHGRLSGVGRENRPAVASPVTWYGVEPANNSFKLWSRRRFQTSDRSRFSARSRLVRSNAASKRPIFPAGFFVLRRSIPMAPRAYWKGYLKLSLTWSLITGSCHCKTGAPFCDMLRPNGITRIQVKGDPAPSSQSSQNRYHFRRQISGQFKYRLEFLPNRCSHNTKQFRHFRWFRHHKKFVSNATNQIAKMQRRNADDRVDYSRAKILPGHATVQNDTDRGQQARRHENKYVKAHITPFK
jgi:hypothetical protein